MRKSEILQPCLLVFAACGRRRPRETRPQQRSRTGASRATWATSPCAPLVPADRLQRQKRKRDCAQEGMHGVRCPCAARLCAWAAISCVKALRLLFHWLLSWGIRATWDPRWGQPGNCVLAIAMRVGYSCEGQWPRRRAITQDFANDSCRRLRCSLAFPWPSGLTKPPASLLHLVASVRFCSCTSAEAAKSPKHSAKKSRLMCSAQSSERTRNAPAADLLNGERERANMLLSAGDMGFRTEPKRHSSASAAALRCSMALLGAEGPKQHRRPSKRPHEASERAKSAREAQQSGRLASIRCGIGLVLSVFAKRCSEGSCCGGHTQEIRLRLVARRGRD